MGPFFLSVSGIGVDARQEGVDQHRERDVRVGYRTVGLEAECDCELLSDGGIRSPGQGISDHSGDEEEEHGQQLEISSEDGTATGLPLVTA